MGLREIFGGDEYDELEKRAREEEQFQSRLTGSVDRFKRQGRQVLAEGEIGALRELYVKGVVDAALDALGREWETFDEMDGALQGLMGEYDIEEEYGFSYDHLGGFDE